MSLATAARRQVEALLAGKLHEGRHELVVAAQKELVLLAQHLHGLPSYDTIEVTPEHVLS